MPYTKPPEPWVISQHRSMSRWVTSVVGETILDFTTELADGLVLCKLVNWIIIESGGDYQLKPVYSRPTFKVQKIENVDDVLQYCRLVLKINIFVSADNVVDGNLKLILGLIWTLFVFSTSHTISIQNETKSFAEVKAILLRWVNSLGHRRALPEIHNFDRDWMLLTESRPDLIFASILDFYIPNMVSYSGYANGKRLANLEEVIELVYSELGIPKLAEANDFNMLVPDEKCVISYVLQWYLFFEVEAADTEVLECEDNCKTAEGYEASSMVYMSKFVGQLLEATKVRNKYETRALRLVNQINNNLSKLKVHLQHIDEYISSAGMNDLLDGYCANINSDSSLQSQVALRCDWPVIDTFASSFMDLLEKYQHFRLVLKPEYAYQDFPELQALYKNVNCLLKDMGVYAGYLPLKLLSLECIGARLQMLLDADLLVAAKLTKEIDSVLNSNLGSLDSLVESLTTNLESVTDKCTEEIMAYIDNLDTLQTFKAEISRARDLIKGAHTTSDLRAMIGSMESLDTPLTPPTPEESEFAKFKGLVYSQNNRSNLTFSDVRGFMKTILCQDDINSKFGDFVQLIPTRRLLNRSDSDDFSTYASDDSEDAPIFDQVQKTLEHKLLGNHNKMYDLEQLVSRIEAGFHV